MSTLLNHPHAPFPRLSPCGIRQRLKTTVHLQFPQATATPSPRLKMPLAIPQTSSASRCVYNVPMAHDLSSHTIGLEPYDAKARNVQHLVQFRESTVGPMPVDLFLDTFLPHSSTERKRMLSTKNAFKSVPPQSKDVTDISAPLVSAVLPFPGSSLTADA